MITLDSVFLGGGTGFASKAAAPPLKMAELSRLAHRSG